MNHVFQNQFALKSRPVISEISKWMIAISNFDRNKMVAKSLKVHFLMTKKYVNEI